MIIRDWDAHNSAQIHNIFKECYDWLISLDVPITKGLRLYKTYDLKTNYTKVEEYSIRFELAHWVICDIHEDTLRSILIEGMLKTMPKPRTTAIIDTYKQLIQANYPVMLKYNAKKMLQCSTCGTLVYITRTAKDLAARPCTHCQTGPLKVVDTTAELSWKHAQG